jgi:hypothetical protein
MNIKDLNKAINKITKVVIKEIIIPAAKAKGKDPKIGGISAPIGFFGNGKKRKAPKKKAPKKRAPKKR